MTEIALVGDLHGNWPATQAAEQDIKSRGITRIWCLGDVVGKGPSSDRTFDWARANCEFILQGNWDEGIGKKMFPRDQFYYDQLGPKRMQALMDFPMEHHCWFSGKKLRLFHGLPILPEPYFVHEDHDLLAPYFEPDFDMVGYADVHRQGVRLFGYGQLLFNTGSVGNGFGIAMAQYAILRGEPDSREEASLDVSMAMVPYDKEQAIQDTTEAGERGLVNADLFVKEIQSGRYARGVGRASKAL